jgi:hypothetical protein
MNFWFQNNFTPAESIFALATIVLVFAAMFLLRDDIDSPRGIVLRGLLMSVYFLWTTLFSVLAWEFSPRVQMDAVIVARNYNLADDRTPARITFARENGSRITLLVPVHAVHGLKQDAPANVTYLTWSNRVVALRYMDGAVPANYPLSELGVDLKVMAENYLAGLVVLGAGIGVFLWIRRNSETPDAAGLPRIRND